jgi:hypothetical protein
VELGIACRKVGECHCELGEYEEAVQYQKRHLEVSRMIGKILVVGGGEGGGGMEKGWRK